MTGLELTLLPSEGFSEDYFIFFGQAFLKSLIADMRFKILYDPLRGQVEFVILENNFILAFKIHSECFCS